jgi:biopolymer transport protein ExbD
VSIRRRIRHQHMIPTASMADIAMLLLIFFMSTTIIKSRELLDIRLPGTTTGDQTRRETTVRISLGPNGDIAFNDARVALPDVGRALAEKLRRNPGLTISLHADSRAPYGVIADVIEQIKVARAPHVTLVAGRKGAL